MSTRRVRRSNSEWRALLAGLLLACALPVRADVIAFEGLLDGEPVTNQYAGLTFANATALKASVSLNELEFPPRSGTNAVVDDGGALEIVFTDPMARVAGYFNYAAPLQLRVFDATNQLVGAVSSLFASNLAISGVPSSAINELLSFSSTTEFTRVVVEGGADGFSFTLDDLTFSRAEPVNGVPEPSTLLLVALGLVGLGRRRGWVVG